MSEQESPRAEGVEQATTKSPGLAKKLVTPEEFITQWPLYTHASVGRFYPPGRVSYYCDTPTCRKETTWLLRVSPQSLEGTDGEYKWVWYLCGLCTKTHLLIVYRELERQERQIREQGPRKRAGLPPGKETVVTKVQKIGQYPAQSIEIPRGLEKNLGEEAIILYKRALVNRNYGYGLGAVTYIRRVVEDKTNELIEVAAELAESHNIDPKIVEKIREAAAEKTTYDQKLRIAATVFPDSLLIEGVNPLGELYDLVSEGVHKLTEEQCIAVADETTSVFEFFFTNLRATTRARQDFVSKVKKWAGRGTAQREAEKEK